MSAMDSNTKPTPPIAAELSSDGGSSGDAPKKRWERWIDSFIDHVIAWGIALICIGASPGLAAWPLAHFDKIRYVLENNLPTEDRKEILVYAAASLVVTAFGYVAQWISRRRREAGLTFAAVAKGLNQQLLPMITFPFLAAFFCDRAEKYEPVLVLTICAFATGVFSYWWFHRLRDDESFFSQEVTAKTWKRAAWAAALLALAYFGYVSYLAVVDHYNLGTHIYDLGIYTNTFWRTSQGDLLGCSYCRGGAHTSNHFDPILVLISPIYWIYQGAESLLVFQTFWLASAAAPLFLLGARRLGNPWYGTWLVAVYLLTPAIHGANMFDFHSLTLLTPTVLWLVYLSERRRPWAYAAMLVLLLITREDMGLLAFCVGVFNLLEKRTKLGLATIASALLYTAFVKGIVMGHSSLLGENSKTTVSYLYYYEELAPKSDEGTRGILYSMLGNPVYTLKVLLNDRKVVYVLQILGPLLFLPLLAGRRLVLLTYGAAFILLASRKHVYSLHFQYTCLVVPLLLACLPEGIQRVANGPFFRARNLSPELVRRWLAGSVLVATFLVGAKFGVLIPNSSFKAGWNRLTYISTPEQIERHDCLYDIIDEIPADAGVCSTSVLGPHLANRVEIAGWPHYENADYIVVNPKGMKSEDQKRLKKVIRSKEFDVIKECSDLQLLKRSKSNETSGHTAIDPRSDPDSVDTQ